MNAGNPLRKRSLMGYFFQEFAGYAEVVERIRLDFRQKEPCEQKCVAWETWQMDKKQETDPMYEKTAEGNLAGKSGTGCEGQGFPNHFRLRHMWNNDYICSTNQGKWTRLSPSVLVCSGCNYKIVLYLLSHLTLCDPIDCSLPGFSVHEICQAKIPECVAMPSSR